MRIRLYHLIALAATLAMVGCDTALQTGAKAGLTGFVTATVNGTLTTLWKPIGDALLAALTPA